MKANKTIYFKDEYEQKLKELGVKTRFVRNLKKYNGYEYIVNQLNKASSFYAFVSMSFTWINTPEGADFWLDIALS